MDQLVVEELTRETISHWFEELHAEGLHASTRVGLLQHVRAYLRWLGERRPLRTSPDELIRSRDMPKLPSYLPRPLTLEADRGLQRRLASSSEPAALGLLLMRRTGLRIGELQGLEYDCLRPHPRTPLLKVPLGKMNNERLVPVDAKIVTLIHRLQAAHPQPRPWLLPYVGEQQMPRELLYKVLDRFSSDLPDPSRITSHRLRHTYATEMLSAGMSLLGVMRLLGHRDYRMTLRYTAITPETISDEYHKALARLTSKYRLPETRAAEPETSPEELLDHLGRWLRMTAPAHRSLRALLKRIHRLQLDVRKLKPPTER